MERGLNRPAHLAGRELEAAVVAKTHTQAVTVGGNAVCELERQLVRVRVDHAASFCGAVAADTCSRNAATAPAGQTDEDFRAAAAH